MHLFKKSIEIPLYRGNLVLIFTNDKVKIQEYLPDFINKEIYAHSWGMNDNDKQGFCIVLNFKSDLRKILPSTIVHEVIHTANFIAESRGIKPDFDNDEPITYLAEWITDETYKFMKEHNFKAEL